MNLQGAQYLVIKGLTITDGGRGIFIMEDGNIPSKFVTLEGNHIHHTGGAGIAANNDGTTYQGMHFFRNEINNTDGKGEGMYLGCNKDKCQFFDGIIENNYIHDLVDPGNPSFDYDGDGIELKYGSYNNIIRDNVIVNTHYPGVTTYGVNSNGNRNIIERNVMWDLQNHGIQAAADTIVQNNLILSAAMDGIHIQAHLDQANPEENVPPVIPGNLDVLNNTVRANVGNNATGFSEVHTGIRINTEAGFTSGTILLANNALYVDGNGFGIRMHQPPAGHPVVFINNIGVEDGIWKTTSLLFDASGNLNDDFVDIFNLDAFPAFNSRLIGTGSINDQSDNDFNSNDRSGSNDVGAYIYSPNGNSGWEVGPGFKN
jgi:hypothetical protein